MILTMTPHERECAFAAIAARIEMANDEKERSEWRKLFNEIEASNMLEMICPAKGKKG